MTPTVRLHRVTAGYGGRNTLHDITFELGPGTFTSIVGPNGAGKTTLMRVLTGERSPSSGSVEVLGATPRELARAAPGSVGHAPQLPALDEFATARGNLRLFGGLLGLSRETIREAEATLAPRLGIERLLDAAASSLSVGQRQRLSLALALLGDPRVILVDEPAAALDAEGRAGLMQELRRRTDQGATVIMITHDLEEAARSDHVVALRGGRLAAEGGPGRLVKMLPYARACEADAKWIHVADALEAVVCYQRGRTACFLSDAPETVVSALRQAGCETITQRPAGILDVIFLGGSARTDKQ